MSVEITTICGVSITYSDYENEGERLNTQVDSGLTVQELSNNLCNNWPQMAKTWSATASFPSFCLWFQLKNLPAMQDTWVRSLSQGDPLEKGMAIHSSYSCLGNPMDRGSYSPWGRKESDMTEQLTLHFQLKTDSSKPCLHPVNHIGAPVPLSLPAPSPCWQPPVRTHLKPSLVPHSPACLSVSLNTSDGGQLPCCSKLWINNLCFSHKYSL